MTNFSLNTLFPNAKIKFNEKNKTKYLLLQERIFNKYFLKRKAISVGLSL